MRMMYRKTIETTEELSRWYDQKYKEMGGGWVTPAEECNRHLDDLGVAFDRSKTLLDVGCGAGHFLEQAMKRCPSLGVDVSSQAIEYCERRLGVGAGFRYSIEDFTKEDHGTWDYIVSIGSLEHVVDLPRALDNIRQLLKPEGRFYFYCPNEKWIHEDQPNERTMMDANWVALFAEHGLKTHWSKVWNDSTAFCGTRDDAGITLALAETKVKSNKLNCGSGQRPFGDGWINLDSNPKWNPDVVADWNDLSMFEDNSMDLVVSHHSLEHVGCGEGDPFITEAYRVLKQGGSLLVFVPDMKALARAWMMNRMDEQIYMTNVYGAYMGDEADRHKWGYSGQSLWRYLKNWPWRDVKAFDWREIHGANIARDFWILGQECIK